MTVEDALEHAEVWSSAANHLKDVLAKAGEVTAANYITMAANISLAASIGLYYHQLAEKKNGGNPLPIFQL